MRRDRADLLGIEFRDKETGTMDDVSCPCPFTDGLYQTCNTIYNSVYGTKEQADKLQYGSTVHKHSLETYSYGVGGLF